MRSPLDFGNSDTFRKFLITKNLAPYKKTPLGSSPPFNYEVAPFSKILNVVDSPDKLIDQPISANELYVMTMDVILIFDDDENISDDNTYDYEYDSDDDDHDYIF